MITMSLLLCFGALIASLNPCTLSVMIMATSSLLGKGKHPKHTGLYILLFTLGIFATYALLGSLVTEIMNLLPVGLIGYIAILLAVLLVVFGLFEVKDYFWYGKGWSFKLSARAEKTIHAWTKKHHSNSRGFLLGVYTALRLSHYTLVMIFAFDALFVLTSTHNLLLPTLWALWYVLPLVLIVLLVMSGAPAHGLTLMHIDAAIPHDAGPSWPP